MNMEGKKRSGYARLGLGRETNIGIGVAIGAVLLATLRRHFQGGICRSKVRLDSKTMIITGANTGIGKETAIDLARRGARVIIACRSADRAEAALQDIRRRSGSTNVVYYNLDLASLDSIRRFSQRVLKEEARVDILINNAGIMRCPYWKTEDGYEMQFGVNHLGHFLLTSLLLDRLKEAPAARIVVVSSLGYKRGKINFDDINSEKNYNPSVAYCQSKLANNLFTVALAKRLKGSNVTVNCLHPGIVWTELGRHFMKEVPIWRKMIFLPIGMLVLKSPKQGAQTTIHCAVAEELDRVSGKYFADCVEQSTLPKATDEYTAEILWKLSEEMVDTA